MNSRLCSGSRRALLVLTGLTIPAAGCEESLPPRNDPQGYLEATLTGESGIVALNADLTPITDLAGGFTVDVKNLYDEVLSAEEAISIDIDFHPTINPSIHVRAHGDRNNIIDPFMVQGSLLTVEPESSATFFIQWDHASAALWDQTGFTFHTLPGISWFQTPQIALIATGAAAMWSGIAPLMLESAQLTINYRIFVGDPQEVVVDSLVARYDPGIGLVRIGWQTPSEYNNHGFKIEKGVEPDSFPIVYPDLIPGQGTFPFPTNYSFVDSLDTSPGLRYYRLQRWYDFGFTVWPLDPTEPTSVIVP